MLNAEFERGVFQVSRALEKEIPVRMGVFTVFCSLGVITTKDPSVNYVSLAGMAAKFGLSLQVALSCSHPFERGSGCEHVV